MRLSPIFSMRHLVAALALSCTFALSGCGDDAKNEPKADAGDKAAKSDDSAGASSGSIQIGDRTIAFTPQMCSSYGEETLISGPGKDADGTPVWVDLDSMSASTGELRVDIGSDKKFSSSDDIIRAAPDTGDFSVAPNSDGFIVKGVFKDGNNAAVGAGTMVVLCK